jgi:hypothetical protein
MKYAVHSHRHAHCNIKARNKKPRYSEAGSAAVLNVETFGVPSRFKAAVTGVSGTRAASELLAQGSAFTHKQNI